MQNRPNFYLILELDPNVAFSDEHFRKALKAKQTEWSRLKTQATSAKKRNLYDQYVKLIPQIQTVMSNPSQREGERQDALKRLDADARAEREKFDNTIRLQGADGFIGPDRVAQLMKQFKSLFPDEGVLRAELQKRNVRVLERRSVQATPEPLPEQKWLEIVQTLEILRRKSLEPEDIDRVPLKLITNGQGEIRNLDDLYGFVGLSSKAPWTQVKQELNRLYPDALRLAERSTAAKAIKELASFVETWLEEPKKRERYDETLRRSRKFPSVDQALRQFNAATDTITPGQVRVIIEDALRNPSAIQAGVRRNEIIEYLEIRGNELGIHIDLPHQSSNDKFVEVPLCPICSTSIEKGDHSCRNCFFRFVVECPICGKDIVHINIKKDKCACGFFLADELRIKKELEQVNEALIKDKAYEKAQATLSLLQRNHKTQNQRGILSREIEKLLKEATQKVAEDNHAIEQYKLATREIDQKIHNHAMFAARKLCEKHKEILPPGEYRVFNKRIDDDINQADELVRQGDAALSRSSDQLNAVEEAYENYHTALSICSDHEDALKKLQSTPPAPPGALTIEELENPLKAVLRWKSSPSANRRKVVYVIERRDYPSTGFHPIGKTRDQMYVDKDVEGGGLYSYRVFTRFGQINSQHPSELDKPFLFIADVSKPTALPGDRQVELRWKPPPGATYIRIEKKTGSTTLPNINLQGHASTFTDTEVENGRRYSYKIVCVYKLPSDEPVLSPGRKITNVTPDSPPKIIQDLELDVVNGANNEIRLSWSPSDKGRIIILESSAVPEFEPGHRMPQNQVQRQGKELFSGNCSESSCQLSLNASRVYFLSILIVHNGMAYWGNCVPHIAIQEVTNLSWSHSTNQDTIELTWNWPNECEQAQVYYGPGVNLEVNDPGLRWLAINRRPGEDFGHCELPTHGHVTMTAIVRSMSGEYGSTGNRLNIVLQKKILTYKVHRLWRWGWGRQEWHLEIEALVSRDIINISHLGVYYSSKAFSNPDNGNLWFQIDGTNIDYPHKLTLSVDQIQADGPVFLRVFALDPSTNHDPIKHPESRDSRIDG